MPDDGNPSLVASTGRIRCCRRHFPGHEFHEVRFCKARGMYLTAQSEEAAEAHDERTPANRINVRARTVAHQQLFVHVELHDMDFEDIGAHVLAKRAEIV